MKQNLRYIRQYIPWLLIILATEGFAALLLWLADIRAFKALFPLLILITIFLFIIISYALTKIEKGKEASLRNFLMNPNKDNEKALLDSHEASKEEIINLLAETIYNKQTEIENTDTRLTDY